MKRKLNNAFDRSRVARRLRAACLSSTLFRRLSEWRSLGQDVLRHCLGGVHGWIEVSGVYAGFGRITEAVGVGLSEAAGTQAIQTLKAWTRTSFVYRWLTKEPDPEVVVIDFRETFTIGPVISLLDRCLTDLTPAWNRSTCRRTIEFVVRYGRRVPVRTVSIVVLMASAIELVTTIVHGDLDSIELGVRLLVVATALLGTRVMISCCELFQSRPIGAIASALKPSAGEEHTPSDRPEPDN